MGLENYSYTDATLALERLEPLSRGSSTGSLSQNASWRDGHLPFTMRREPLPKGSASYTSNGDGEPLYSWRCTLLFFMAGVRDTVKFDEPWYSSVNTGGSKRYRFFSYAKPGDFHSYSEPTANEAVPDAIALAITGPGTAFGDANEPPKLMRDLPPDIILIVEVRASGIPWPAPGDFDIRTMPQTINASDGKGISSCHAGGFHVIFADRQVWFLSEEVPFDLLKKFFTIADARNHDREQVLGPYALDRVPKVGLGP